MSGGPRRITMRLIHHRGRAMRRAMLAGVTGLALLAGCAKEPPPPTDRSKLAEGGGAFVCEKYAEVAEGGPGSAPVAGGGTTPALPIGTEVMVAREAEGLDPDRPIRVIVRSGEHT